MRKSKRKRRKNIVMVHQRLLLLLCPLPYPMSNDGTSRMIEAHRFCSYQSKGLRIKILSVVPGRRSKVATILWNFRQPTWIRLLSGKTWYHWCFFAFLFDIEWWCSLCRRFFCTFFKEIIPFDPWPRMDADQCSYFTIVWQNHSMKCDRIRTCYNVTWAQWFIVDT